MSQRRDPAGPQPGRRRCSPIEGATPRLRRGCAGAITAVVEIPAVDVTRAQLQRELDATRLAVVSLLAVTSHDQFRAVEQALMALAPMSEISHAALEELRTARHERLAAEEAARAPENPKAV